LSVDAAHWRLMLVVVRARVTTPVGVEGAWASVQALVAAIVCDLVDWFPAESNASTARVYVVPHARPPTTVEVLDALATRCPLT
jgi:hypothetical protein